MPRFAVIGLGRYGQHLAKALMAAGSEVIAIDRQGKHVEALRDEVTLAVRLDSTDADALKTQGLSEVDAAVVGIGTDFESAVLTVAVLKDLGVQRIYARAESDIQARIMTTTGADATVNPEKESALRWAHRLTLPNLQQYVDLGESHALVYIKAPPKLCHKTLAELNLRAQYGVNLVAIKREVAVSTEAEPHAKPTPVISVPEAGTTILPQDVLVVVGSNEALAGLPAD
ncbi:MAG: potassium channel family protein [Phycisphaerae bacterium]